MKSILCLSLFCGAVLWNLNALAQSSSVENSLTSSMTSSVATSAAKPERKKIVLGVLDKRHKSDFESQLLPFIQAEMQDCQNCEVRNLSPYNEKGEVQLELIKTAIAEAPGQVQILFLNWNEKLVPSNEDLKATLVQVAEKGVVLVASAGQPNGNEGSAPLSRTIAGQIRQAIIIGELGERDRLVGASFYGPEMLTAIRPTPKALIGSGLSPCLFATRLAKNFSMRQDWLGFFQEKKQKTRKIWLEMNDLFAK